MAKINMDYEFKTFDGESVPRDSGKTKKVKKGNEEIEEAVLEDTTLKHVCMDALLNPEVELGPDGKPRPVDISGQKKFDRWALATKINNANGVINLKSEEITLLKNLIGKGFGPIVVGPAWDVLEGKGTASPKK